MKLRTHQIVMTLRTDKPCTKAQAIAMAKDCIHGTFYPYAPNAGDAETFKVGAFKATLRAGQG